MFLKSMAQANQQRGQHRPRAGAVASQVDELDQWFGRAAYTLTAMGFSPAEFVHWSFDLIRRILDLRKERLDHRSMHVQNMVQRAKQNKHETAIRWVIPLREEDFSP